MKCDYRPLRIILDATVAAATKHELGRLYPHCEIVRAHGGTAIGIYKSRRVINAPTRHERDLLALKPDGKNSYALEIPQHRDGYDIPTSNIARSRKGSLKGRQMWEVVVARAKREDEQKKSTAKTKREARKDRESESKPKSSVIEGATASTKKDMSRKTTSSVEKIKPKGGEK